jgi:GTPase-activating protein BEM2
VVSRLFLSRTSLTSGRKNIYSDESNRRGFERLNNIEKEVLTLQFDHRGIKEEVVREAAALPTRKAIRPFHKVIAIQIEKNRRDRNLRIRLQREKLQEQSKIERRDEFLNKAMRPRKQPLSMVQKQHRNKKSMSAFLNFMRPISSAFGAEIPQPFALKRTPSELDFPLTSKPSLVLSVMDARVAQFINNERSYTLQLDTDDGGHYLLQAMSKREMNKWLETISRVTKMAAKRRLTYLGNSPKPRISDHIHSSPIVASRDPKAGKLTCFSYIIGANCLFFPLVFGVELEFLLRRETGSERVPPGTVPTIIEQCLREIECRGLSEVGICTCVHYCLVFVMN